MRTKRLTIAALTGIAFFSVAQFASSQTLRAVDLPWAGSARCQLDIRGVGYTDQQIHTWTLMGGSPTIQGDFRIYAGTWSVTGSGSFRRTQGTQTTTRQWTNNVQGVRAPIAVVVRASDGAVLVQTGHGQLRAVGAVTGSQQVTVDGKPQPPSQIVADVFEWALPRAEGSATSTSISGSSMPDANGSLGYLQPADARSTATCSWQFTRGGSVSSASAATATVQSSTAVGGLAPAGSGGSIQSAPAPSPTMTVVPLAPTIAAATAPTSTPPPEPVAIGCDADTPVSACVLPAMNVGMSASNSGNFHVAADTADWYTVTAYDGAPTVPFAVMDVSLSGGSSDGQYAIEVSEGSAASPVVLGLTAASHAPRVTVSWAATGVPSKLLRIKVSHVAGQPSNDLYSLRLMMSESATAPLTVMPLSPQILNATLPSGSTSTQGTQTTQTTQSSSGPPTAVGCDADSPLVACVLPPMNVGMSTINSGNFHVAADTDWYVVTAYAPSPTATYAVLDVSLGGGSPDGQFAIEVSEGSLSSPVILGTSPASHTPRVTVSWAAANATSKLLRIKLSHVAGQPSNDLYSLRLTMSESATAPLTVVPLSPQIINAVPVGGR